MKTSSVKSTKKVAKKQSAKVAKKTVVKKSAKSVKSAKPAKTGVKPRTASTSNAVSAGEKKTVDSTTAWAQKRGLKQIVIWGPESVRDKVRAASKRDSIPMSTWILDAVASKLGGVKSVKSVKAKTKEAAVVVAKTKSKTKKPATKKTSDTFVDDGSKGINLPAVSESVAGDVAA